MANRSNSGGSSDSDLQLLLAHADEHEPVLQGGLEADAAAQDDESGDGESGTSFYNPGAAGNDLAAQGWGIIAPEGDDGDRLLAAIAPLIAARQEQLGEAPPVFRVPPGMSASDADNWRRDVYESADADEQPFYQLVLGDLDQVSVALSQAQAIDGCVGRLAFDELSDYEAYAAKVLRVEGERSGGVADLIMHTVHDGTAATSIGSRSLARPLRDLAIEAHGRGRLPMGEIIDSGDNESPAPEQLMDAVSGRDGALLFSVSHGEGAPRKGWASVDEQRAGQGAMSFGRGGHIRGDDLRSGSFLAGGIWFMFACYGAGTPSDSRFRHWLQQLRDAGKFRGKAESVLRSLPAAGERPFVAAIPRQTLANPDGPLAFIGHLDLAWTYSFQELDRGKKDATAGKFYKVVRALLRGDRVGIALREITRAYLDKNENLANRYDAKRSAQVKGEAEYDDRVQMAHLWMARQELAGYTILGDPAVSLCSAGAAKTPVKRPAVVGPTRAVEIGRRPDPKSESESAEPESDVQSVTPLGAVELDRRVEAVQAMIIGDEGLRAIAKRFEVDRTTLTRWLQAYTDAGRLALGKLDR